MSGLVGSITSASKEFNDIGANSIIEGIKMANFLNGKIATVEKERKQPPNELSQENILETSNLAEDIRQDMEESMDR